MRPWTSGILLVLLATLPADAQTSSGTGGQTPAAAFAQRLLTAIARRDTATLGSMFKYPATVRTGNISLPIANQAALTKAFDTVFTPELGCALERHPEATDDSLGGGVVHLEPSAGSFLITRIDEPAGAAPAAPRPAPQRVDVPSGQIQRAGNLAVGGADRYVMAVRQGDVVQARVERFQGRAIGVRVIDTKSGRAISNGGDAARVVSATATQAGEVAVEVTRLTFCEPSASYLLTISKRR